MIPQLDGQGFRDVQGRLFNSAQADPDEFEEYFVEKTSAEARLAFLDVAADNTQSLKERLENGLNPDERFFQGHTLLHLIALKSSLQFFKARSYREVLVQLVRSGADLEATNDSGQTALDFMDRFKSEVLIAELTQAKRVGYEIPVDINALNARLAIFSFQKNPTPNGKKLILELIKSGADPAHITPNGKTVLENIHLNWHPACEKSFVKIIFAAKIKCVLNGHDKNFAKRYPNDPWYGAVAEFLKTDDLGSSP